MTQSREAAEANSFAEAFEASLNFKTPAQGELLRGQIVSISGDDAFVSYGGPSEAVMATAELDGLDVARALRAESSVPIVMLTGRSEESDKLVGLELGADDYITKPFSMREFRSRVKAVLRRSELQRDGDRGEALIEDHDLYVDPTKRAVEVRGEPVRLTYVEFEILSILARSPGRVFSRAMLLERLWGDAAYRDPRTIDVHIRHLREKIEHDPKEPELIFTVRGVGYHFRDR